MSDKDLFEPWRRSFPRCKPFDNVRSDGQRFCNEFLESMAAFDADDYFSGREVLLGEDGPAAVNPNGIVWPAGAANNNQGRSKLCDAQGREKRLKQYTNT